MNLKILITTLVAISCISCQKKDVVGTDKTSSDDNYADTVFWQETHDAFPGVGAAMNEVRSITLDVHGNTWIATAAGIFTMEKNQRNWKPALPEDEQGPAFAVKTVGNSIWASTWKNVYRFSEGVVKIMDGARSPIASLCASAEGVYALGPHGAWLYNGTVVEKKNYRIARSVRDVCSDGSGGLWIATDVGLYHSTAEGTRHYVDTSDVVSAYIQGVARNGDEVWAAGLGGISVINAGELAKKILPLNGLPSVHLNCVRRSPTGEMWVGTDVGAVRYAADGRHSLRFSPRWLTDDRVNDITFDSLGNAWIATANGVNVIRKKKMTLANKAEYYYGVLMRRHIRDPWIAGQCRLPIAGDTTQWEPEDDDNDGEYTGNYLAMESFRYASTKNPDAREKAKKAFHFLKLLQDVTGTNGFFARTIVPSTWTTVHDGNRTYSERQLADELVKEPRFKPVTIRWHTSDDGKWMWKGDTSSDEICGHMFGYFMYYELAADEGERDAVRKHVALIVDHLMANNFTLTDVDGLPTRWGVWSPEHLNRNPEWSPDRSLNSMEILSFLKLVYYMTGDEKYQSTYLKLIEEEGYLKNMANIPNQNPAWFIYFDVILAAYQYPILLRCEKDPELLAFYQKHIDQWLASRKEDHNPLINFIYSFARQSPAGLQASVDFLVDTPLDLIDWPIDHTKREDITLVHNPVLDEWQVDNLQPASIRATVRWDKNPWGIQGGNPNMEREPVFWLLPYWMGKYLEMIK